MSQMSVPVSAALGGLKTAVIAGQAVALLLFQLVAVLGVLKLSRWSEPVVTVAAMVTPEREELTRQQVMAALSRYAKSKGMTTGKELAAALDEPNATMHRVLKPGEHKVSAEVLRRVMTKLEEKS